MTGSSQRWLASRYHAPDGPAELASIPGDEKNVRRFLRLAFQLNTKRGPEAYSIGQAGTLRNVKETLKKRPGPSRE